MWDNGGRNIKLDQAEIIDIGPHKQRCCSSQKLERALTVWLVGWLKHETWSSTRELEMLDMPWFNVEEWIQRLREIGMLEWMLGYICHLKPTH